VAGNIPGTVRATLGPLSRFVPAVLLVVNECGLEWLLSEVAGTAAMAARRKGSNSRNGCDGTRWCKRLHEGESNATKSEGTIVFRKRQP
jgi:hypothetical protein